jgi:glycosyltransferase involved in cell wall biosynthesis
MEKKLRKNLPDGVSLLGHVSYEERQSRLSQAQVLVATTVREGWGLNVSEAAAVGTPTIGYDSPGLRDSIPMSGGLVVTVSPDALAQAIIDFFQGKIVITPKIATRPWSDVCAQIEFELQSAVDRTRS